jgi:phosphoserine phosphatase
MYSDNMENKWVIFDLDGTIADIEVRREKCTYVDGKMDWDCFFDPENIDLDEPNIPVIEVLKKIALSGTKIIILSGRSNITQEVTEKWLSKYDVPYHLLKMRPTTAKWKYMPDDQLKKIWLDELFPGEKKKEIICTFDDRDKVVNMWRENGLTCMQVAPGNF